MRIIYGICSWGLGHATRSLPIIRKLIEEGNHITIISHGHSLRFLQKELGDDRIRYFDVKDYPIPIAETKGAFVAKTMLYWPKFMSRMHRGLRFVTKLLEKERIDVIISDGRYDIYSRRVPSFLINHQVRILNPFHMKIFEFGSEIYNLFFLKDRFVKFLVPDYEKDDLSGKLSHNLKLIRKNKLAYIGVLSDFKKKSFKKDIDYLISLTGPEPQRSILEKILLSQVEELDGKIAVTLGRPDKSLAEKKGNMEIYSIVDKKKREELLNRAKMIISRSGYSTIMDLAVVKTKALLIPTPGQVEQEYLARYHMKRGNFYYVEQDRINLVEDIKKAEKFSGIKRECNVDKSVERVIEEINNSR